MCVLGCACACVLGVISSLAHHKQLGVNVFNTSDLYGAKMGDNEALLGRALQSSGVPREQIIITTKFGPHFVDDPAAPNGRRISHDQSPAYARAACEAALKRLQTPYIDLFTLRGPIKPGGTDVPALMRELEQLKEEGKIRAVGLSETSAADIRAAAAATPPGLIAAIEQEWSLFERGLEDDLLPTCRELSISVLAYSPLARGLLTGRFTPSTVKHELGTGDFRAVGGAPWFSEQNIENNYKLVQQVEKIAAAKGVKPSQLALAWVLRQAPDVVPIPGTRRISTLEENVAAATLNLTDDDMAALEKAVPKGSAAGARYAHAALTYKGDGGAAR